MTNIKKGINHQIADELKELDDITAINLNAESSSPSISEPASVSIPTIEIGKSTLNMDSKNEETWDGYNSIDNMKTQEAEMKMSAAELLREIRNIEEIREIRGKRCILGKKYTMESDLLEMKGEYET